MNTQKPIKSALISVFSKEGLEPIVRKLHEQNVTFYSTGGTQQFIESLGIPVVAVEDVTSYPSILGGRVKTLHPKIFGGILNRQDHQGDVQQMERSEEHTSELQSRENLVCRLLLEKKKSRNTKAPKIASTTQCSNTSPAHQSI